jgi:hypothetical protein
VARRRQRRGDRGAAAVEAALVLPLILMVVFGIIDFGRMLNAQIVVSQAAREAARAESVGGSPDARADDAAATIGGVDSDVQESCGDNPDPDDIARVRVTFDFEFVTPLTALAGLVTDNVELDGVGVMPCRG